MSMRIRAAVAEDAAAIAHVHVASWRTTYRGVLPDALLDSLDESQRAAFWAGILSKPEGRSVTVLEADRKVVGFASTGPIEPAGTFELFAIYILKEHQGRGGGTMLLGSAFDAAHEAGATSLIAWVLEGNPAEAFYRSLGGKRTGASRTENHDGREVRDVCYEWDAAVLAR